MDSGQSLLVFSIDDQRYALPAVSVKRVLRAIAIAPLSLAPAMVLGLINLGGSLIVVIDMRRRCGHPSRPMQLSDHLIVASTGPRLVALLVDQIQGLVDLDVGDLWAAGESLPGLDLLVGAVKLEDGLIFVHDLEKLLSLEDEMAIDSALRKPVDPEIALTHP